MIRSSIRFQKWKKYFFYFQFNRSLNMATIAVIVVKKDQILTKYDSMFISKNIETVKNKWLVKHILGSQFTYSNKQFCHKWSNHDAIIYLFDICQIYRKKVQIVLKVYKLIFMYPKFHWKVVGLGYQFEFPLSVPFLETFHMTCASVYPQNLKKIQENVLFRAPGSLWILSLLVKLCIAKLNWLFII